MLAILSVKFSMFAFWIHSLRFFQLLFSNVKWCVWKNESDLWRELCFTLILVPAASPSRGGDVTVYVWHKPTECAHCFSFCSCAYFCLYGPFRCILFLKFSRQLSVFLLCSSGLISASVVLSTIMSLYESLPSLDIIRNGWLGSKHQLPTYLDITFEADWTLSVWTNQVSSCLFDQSSANITASKPYFSLLSCQQQA